MTIEQANDLLIGKLQRYPWFQWTRIENGQIEVVVSDMKPAKNRVANNYMGHRVRLAYRISGSDRP